MKTGIATIEYVDARELLHHIVRYARENSSPVAIVVLDAFGNQLASAVLPGAEPLCLTYALKKAKSALNYRTPTIRFRHDGTEDGGWQVADVPTWSNLDVQAGFAHDPDFIPWGGGDVVRSPHDAAIIGAIGVSGLSEIDDDRLASLRPTGWTA